jgi:hypothetical protein
VVLARSSYEAPSSELAWVNLMMDVLRGLDNLNYSRDDEGHSFFDFAYRFSQCYLGLLYK